MIRRAAVLAALLALAPPAQASTLDLGELLRPAAPPAPTQVAADGALVVSSPLSPLAAPDPTEPLFPRVDGRGPIGFNDLSSQYGGLTPAQTDATYRGVGATIARVPVNWAAVEPKPPGNQYWSALDGLYRAYVAAGIRPLWLVGARTPAWAVANVLKCAQGPCQAPPADRLSGEYARFAADLARRYPLAAGIEIWNEPNLRSHWDTTPFPIPPSAGAYTRLLGLAYTRIKAVNPAMRVIGGALSNFGVWDPSGAFAGDSSGVAMRPFLRGMLAAGAARYMDALSFHPYPYDNAQLYAWNAFEVASSELAHAGVPNMRLVASEIGVSTNDLGFRFTEAERADALVAMRRALEAPSSTVPGAERTDALIFHTVLEYGTGYGWLARQGGSLTPRPVYCAFAALAARTFPGCPA